MSRFATSSSLIALALLTCACHDQNPPQATTLRHNAVEFKPTVALVPVIDSTNNTYAWNLSQEFTVEIGEKLSEKDQMKLAPLSQVRAAVKKLNASKNPFGTDISWIKNSFPNNDFVVFLELVEHEEVIKQDRKNIAPVEQCSAEFNMSMRVRAFDLRGATAKVVLQELFRDSRFVPRPFNQANFHQTPWNTVGFSTSPLGMAHQKFTKEIAAQIEDYIHLNARR